MSENSQRQVNLLDFLAFLLRWKSFIIGAVLAVAAVVAVISLVATPRYRSSALIKSAESSSSGLGGMLAARLASMSGIASIMPSLGEIPGEMFILILKSRWMSEQMIEHFDLRRRWEMEDEPTETVIEMLKTRTHFELDPKSSTVQIWAEDEDPRLAQEMAQFLVDQLDRRNQELRAVSASREKEFIGQRLLESQQSLTALEDSLAAYQRLTGLISPEDQIRATIAAASTLEGERLLLLNQLQVSQRMFQQSPEALFLKLKLASIDSTLGILAQSRGTENRSDFLAHVKDAPEHAIQFVRLRRDIEIQSILSALLIQQYEQAKIDEVRNTPTLMRLDPPAVATARIWPRRSLMVGAAGAGTFVLAVAVALLIEFFRLAAADQAHPQHARVLALRDGWSGRRRRQ